jgi:hypothetical protein
MKNNKGVTMMLLVITIILMIILSSYAIYYSENIAPEARLGATYTSLKNVKEACERAVNDIEIGVTDANEFYFFGNNIRLDGSDIEDLAKRCGLESGDQFGTRTYVIGLADTPENQRRVANLEITGLTQDYVVDLDNEKYYVLDGIRKADKTIVYEYKDIKASYQLLNKSH